MTLQEYADLPLHECKDCGHIIHLDDKSWACTILLASNNDMRCPYFIPKEYAERQGD